MRQPTIADTPQGRRAGWRPWPLLSVQQMLRAAAKFDVADGAAGGSDDLRKSVNPIIP
jgi:hypothetical protein